MFYQSVSRHWDCLYLYLSLRQSSVYHGWSRRPRSQVPCRGVEGTRHEGLARKSRRQHLLAGPSRSHVCHTDHGPQRRRTIHQQTDEGLFCSTFASVHGNHIIDLVCASLVEYWTFRDNSYFYPMSGVIFPPWTQENKEVGMWYIVIFFISKRFIVSYFLWW